jgi:hypothetical protein
MSYNIEEAERKTQLHTAVRIMQHNQVVTVETLTAQQSGVK